MTPVVFQALALGLSVFTAAGVAFVLVRQGNLNSVLPVLTGLRTERDQAVDHLAVARRGRDLAETKLEACRLELDAARSTGEELDAARSTADLALLALASIRDHATRLDPKDGIGKSAGRTSVATVALRSIQWIVEDIDKSGLLDTDPDTTTPGVTP